MKSTKAAKKKKSSKVALTKKQRDFLVSLRENMGIVSETAAQHNIHRNTHYLWMKNPNYAKEVEDINEDCIDFAESKLQANINAGSSTDIQFYLRTRGRKRGYVEKIETGMTDSAGNDVKPKPGVIIIGGKPITFE